MHSVCKNRYMRKEVLKDGTNFPPHGPSSVPPVPSRVDRRVRGPGVEPGGDHRAQQRHGPGNDAGRPPVHYRFAACPGGSIVMDLASDPTSAAVGLALLLGAAAGMLAAARRWPGTGPARPVVDPANVDVRPPLPLACPDPGAARPPPHHHTTPPRGQAYSGGYGAGTCAGIAAILERAFTYATRVAFTLTRTRRVGTPRPATRHPPPGQAPQRDWLNSHVRPAVFFTPGVKGCIYIYMMSSSRKVRGIDDSRRHGCVCVKLHSYYDMLNRSRQPGP